MGFKTKIYITLATLLALGYGIFTFVNYSQSKKLLGSNIAKNLGNIAKYNAKDISHWGTFNLNSIKGFGQIIAKYHEDE